MGLHMPGQDLAISLEMAMLEIQARPLVSPALGRGGVMSKHGFYGGLSSSGVAVGVRADPKAP